MEPLSVYRKFFIVENELIFRTPLVIVNFSGKTAMFSIIIRRLIFLVYNKLLLKSQHIFFDFIFSVHD